MGLSSRSIKLAVAALAAFGVIGYTANKRLLPSVTATEMTLPVTLDTTRPASEIETPIAGWNFRNHVIPVLTRLGCNSGACHGAAAGKNGFKLTLRGFDPEMDYNVLSRQSLGRRINQIEPAR